MNFKELYYTYFRGVRKNLQQVYYTRGFLMLLMPKWLCRWRARRIEERVGQLSDSEKAYVMDRVNYYCRLRDDAGANVLADYFATLADNNFLQKERGYLTPIAKKKKRLAGPIPFFFDSYEFTRLFPQHLRWHVEGGDVSYEEPVPTITKSRLVPQGDNPTNNVLLNLNKMRHFVFFKDPIPWQEKQTKVVFRGVVKHKPRRQQFLDMWQGHRLCDLKDGGGMSLYDHLQYRYIMALEGNDVASNLKWVMSSNCLAVMPRPTYETWFMEGRLVGGYHYVEIADDYHDLIEKVEYYEAHPDEALAILEHAHEWVEQFQDKKREEMISYLVMDKYLKQTNK